jgi:acylphosphatase
VSKPSTVQCRAIYYRGHVQGVGFRYTTQRIASRFAVTGYVKNLPDGRVLVVVEGEQAELDRFVAAVSDRLGHYVADVQSSLHPVEGTFHGFGIEF